MRRELTIAQNQALKVSGRSLSRDTLPDNGLLHDYDARNITAADGDTINKYPDTKAGEDAIGQAMYRDSFSDFEGYPAVEFDGSSAELGNDIVTLLQPLVLISVFTNASVPPDDGQSWFIRGKQRFGSLIAWGSNEYRADAGVVLSGGTPNSLAHIKISIFDNKNSEIRLDKSSLKSGDTGLNGMDGIQIGSSGGANYFKGMTTRHLIYDLSQIYEGQIGDAEKHLSELYNVSMS